MNPAPATCKVGILAGGLGTRLSELTEVQPKPMVEVGGRPILWHIMKLYAHHGFREFALALGYRGDVIRNYFLNYWRQGGSLTVHAGTGEVRALDGVRDDWTVHLLETGPKTMTGGRVKRIADFLKGETFMLTYGDGVANVDVRRLLEFHRAHGRLATVTAVRPPARFGEITLDGEMVKRFEEKPQVGQGWVNGGFFVFEPGVASYIDGDETVLEREPLERLAADGQLAAFRHEGFWQPMDTLRDMRLLEQLWSQGHAPWKVWKE